MAYNDAKTTQKPWVAYAQPIALKHVADTRVASDGSKRLKELLKKGRHERWASYRLAERLAGSRHTDEEAPGTTQGDSRHSGISPVTAGQPPGVAPEEDPVLLAIAEPARTQMRLGPDEMRSLIRSLCQGRFLTFRQLATLPSREPNGLQRWTLRPMALERQLLLAYPDTPNHPKQVYQSNPDWRKA